MAMIQTQGKRKQAIARASLSPGKGVVRCNGRYLNQYDNSLLKLRMMEPLLLAGDVAKTVNIDVLINGGGANGQADAGRLAIARALVEHDPKLKSVFINYDRLLLVADVRRKEERKPNDSKARAARQKSYR